MLLFKLLKEVALINEQKFLAELGKLLTFMYEEDRQTAIELYAQMFASTADEHALMLFLASPTRQAVQVARAYNAKERKLQVHAQSKNEDGLEYDPDEVPDFVLAINKIALSAAQIAAPVAGDEAAEREVPEGQFSLFDEASAEAEPAAAEQAVAEPVEQAPVEVPAPVEVTEAAAAEEQPAPAVEAPSEEVVAEAAEGTEAAPVEEAREEAAEAENAPAKEAEDKPAEADIPAAAPEDDFAVVIPELQDEAAPVEETEASATPAVEDMPAAPAAVEMQRKPRIALLILFIILAVPITLIGVVLLLIPTLLCLSLALGFIVAGVAALVSAFAGFAVFADILVMLGLALAGLALGLLFLWLFVWFIGGAIVGLIKSVIALGASWCYKEVPAV